MFMFGGQNSGFCKVSLRTSYISLFECKGPSMLKTCKLHEKVPCTALLNYLHIFVFNIFSVFNTLYLHN